MDKTKQILKKFYQNKTLFIIVCVICLSSLTIGVSYSAFFSVKTNSVNQTIQTGTLTVTYSGNTAVLAYDTIEPLTDEEGMAQTANRIVTVQNTSTIDSKYTVTVGYDMTSFLARADYNANDELTPIEYARLAIYEYDTTNSTSTLIGSPISISELPIYELNSSDSRYNRYSLLIDTVGNTTSGNATKTYQIKIWLSDDATAAATDTYFYFNTEVVARPDGDTLNYTINGILQNESGTAISGATISLHNGSIVTTTGTNGAFTLENVPVGTYNLDITASNVRYQANLTVSEGATKDIKILGTSFSATNSDIYSKTYQYKTTTEKIIDVNDIIDITSGISLNGYYVLAPTYELTGAYDANIGSLIIKIGYGRVYDMYFDGEKTYYYWNDSFTGTYRYSCPLGQKSSDGGTTWTSGSPTTYPTLAQLQSNYANFANSPVYIKTTTKHEACLYYNSHEFCLSANYWDTDGLTTKTKLQTAMEAALSTTASSCDSGSDDASCNFGLFGCGVGSDGRVRCLSILSGAICIVYSDIAAYCD